MAVSFRPLVPNFRATNAAPSALSALGSILDIACAILAIPCAISETNLPTPWPRLDIKLSIP